MLKSKNLASVLSQSIQDDHERPGSTSTIISSILCTNNGRPIASTHNSNSLTTTTTSTNSTDPYSIDKSMKSKVYGLLGSQAWNEYSHANNNNCSWVAVSTSDAQLVIHPVNLADNQLLLMIVADPSTALGILEKKAKETVVVLEEGLKGFKIYD